MSFQADGRYIDGTKQTDITLLYNFIQICKDIGGYDGELLRKVWPDTCYSTKISVV